MDRRSFLTRSAAVAGVGLAAASAPARAQAQATTVRVSHGFGILYLPLIVMRDQKMIEKQAKADGLGDINVEWAAIDGGNVINDAMLSGNLDIAGIGSPGFLTLWSKSQGIPRSEVIGLGALSTAPLYMNTNNPRIKSLRDFTPKDRIAVPGIKTSLQAVILQMAVAKEFGIENYAKLDPLTVSMPHPEAVVALLSGKTEITAHFTSPPFSHQELDDPKISKVLNSADTLGNITLNVVFGNKSFVDKNPKLIKSFLAAREQAAAFIAKDRRAAADAFLRVSKVKMAPADVEKILADPDTKFTTTPDGVMNYAEFMSRAGTIKTRPKAWTDLFIPEMASRKGS